MDFVRWGILSVSNHYRLRVHNQLLGSELTKIFGIASRNSEKASKAASELGIVRSYGSYEALLEDPEIDAVYIPLPNHLHTEWIKKAAEAGKHVLCEKPFAMDAPQAQDAVLYAESKHVKVMEAFMYRFHPQIVTAQDLVSSGAIGDLHHMHAAFTFRLTNPQNIRLQADLGGGALMDVGCYCVNVLRTFAGREPIEVQALAAWHAHGVDERLTGLLRFDDDLTGQFDCALNLARRETFLAAGTEATLELPRAFLPGVNDTIVRLRKNYSDLSEQTIAGIDEYRLMVEHFADCVRSGHLPRHGAREAACNMNVIEALYRSAHAGGQPVAVPPCGSPQTR